MKRAFQHKRLIILVIIIILFTQCCYAEEEKPDNSLTEKIETLLPKEGENGSIQDEVGKLLPKGSNFEFNEIDTEKIVDKTQATGDQLYLIAQAYSWPLFIGSIILGVACLFIGGLFNSSWLKKIGGFFLLMAVLRVVIINYAPELVATIINFIESLKGG